MQPSQPLSTIDALLLCLLLLAYDPFRRRDGELFALMMSIYPVTRFLIEGLRSDEAAVFGTGMSIAQCVSLLLLVCAAALWFYILRQPKGWRSRNAPLSLGRAARGDGRGPKIGKRPIVTCFSTAATSARPASECCSPEASGDTRRRRKSGTCASARRRESRPRESAIHWATARTRAASGVAWSSPNSRRSVTPASASIWPSLSFMRICGLPSRLRARYNLRRRGRPQEAQRRDPLPQFGSVAIAAHLVQRRAENLPQTRTLKLFQQAPKLVCGGRTIGLRPGRHEDVVLDVRRDGRGSRRAQVDDPRHLERPAVAGQQIERQRVVGQHRANVPPRLPDPPPPRRYARRASASGG